MAVIRKIQSTTKDSYYKHALAGCNYCMWIKGEKAEVKYKMQKL